MTDVKLHTKDSTKPYPKDENPLLYELSTFLESTGITDPLKKVYISHRMKLNHFPFVVFLTILSQIPKLSYIKNVGKQVRLGEDYCTIFQSIAP